MVTKVQQDWNDEASSIMAAVSLMELAREKGPADPLGQQELAVAGLVWRAMRDDRVEFAFQSVRNASNPDVVLYHECLARLTDEEGREVSPGEFIPALEAIGLVRLFDRYVVRRVVELLHKHATVQLGVNISALSAIDDELWAPTFDFLSARPEIACRLVVEITETAAVDLLKSRIFAQRLRRTGCRIAVDDFGAGYSFRTGVAVARADIVKIDASCISKISQGICSPVDLDAFVACASRFASCLIIEGVETAEDFALARQAGIEWVQGYWLGQPLRQSLWEEQQARSRV
jgi:EAL domain-containing protein (putative c-di-GMP-specific phosphodiesterase class I)